MGRIQVAGLTLPEVQALVTKALSKVLRDPQIDIKVVGYRSQRVFLSGEVKVPGIYPVDDVPLSLPEILHRAGGFTALGDGSNVQLIRNHRAFAIDFVGLQKRGVSLDSLILQPGDQIRVPSSEEQKAYLLGEVSKPSSVRLVNGRLNLVQALADAGGFNVLTANNGRRVHPARPGQRPYERVSPEREQHPGSSLGRPVPAPPPATSYSSINPAWANGTASSPSSCPRRSSSTPSPEPRAT